MDLEGRIRRLEFQNRRFRWLLVINLLILLAILSTGAVFAFSPSDKTSQASPVVPSENSSEKYKTIRATRFELVDSTGKTLAVLGLIGKHPFDGEFVAGGNPGLAILDRDGNPQVRLCGPRQDNGISSEGFTMYSLDGKYKMNVKADIMGANMVAEFGTLSLLDVGITQGPSLGIIFNRNFAKPRFRLDFQSLIFADDNGHITAKFP